MVSKPNLETWSSSDFTQSQAPATIVVACFGAHTTIENEPVKKTGHKARVVFIDTMKVLIFLLHVSAKHVDVRLVTLPCFQATIDLELSLVHLKTFVKRRELTQFVRSKDGQSPRLNPHCSSPLSDMLNNLIKIQELA